MNTAFSRSSIERLGPHWIPAVEFACDLWPQIHPEALAELGLNDLGLCERLARSPRGRAKLNAAIHCRAEFAKLSPFDFEQPAMRLALLPASEFLTVFHFAAAAELAPAIAKTVNKREREALHSKIGADAWTFAIKRAALMLKRDAANVKRDFVAVRSDILESYFAAASPAFKQRLRFKTPPSWNASFELPRSDEARNRAQSLVLQICRMEFRSLTESLELWGNAA